MVQTFKAGYAESAPVEPALYGLLSPAAHVVNETDVHWENGHDYETLLDGAGIELTSICAGITSVPAVTGSGPLYRDYFPFTVTTKFKCSTMSLKPGEVEEVAEDFLKVAIQFGLEYEFWTGALAKAAEGTTAYNEVIEGPYPNRYLSNSSAVLLTSNTTGVKARHALALMENAIDKDNIGVRGTIHVSALVASALNIKPQGGDNENGYVVTNRGNYVVIGSGYPGTGPTGAPAPDANEAWMFGHAGRVTVHLGEKYVVPDKTSQAVNSQINTTEYFASQVVGATWPTGTVYAALVDLSLDYS
jgi:hypothetical protein